MVITWNLFKQRSDVQVVVVVLDSRIVFVKRICKSEENDHSNNQFCTKKHPQKNNNTFFCNLVRQTRLANISSFSASLKQPLSILLNSQLKSATSRIPCHILFFCIQCNAVNINNHDTEITPLSVKQYYALLWQMVYSPGCNFWDQKSI